MSSRATTFIDVLTASLSICVVLCVFGCASDGGIAVEDPGPTSDGGTPLPDGGDVADLNDHDGDGFESAQFGGLDCNDGDAAINPHATEVCGDGVDNDCDGSLICDTGTIDADGDDHGSVASGGTDCDDGDPLVNPGAEEVCGDGQDDDCNGFAICDGGSLDDDGDDYASISSGGTDCDDGDPLANPGLPGRCPCPAGEYRDDAGECVTTDPGYYSPDGDFAQHPSGEGSTAEAGSAEATISPAGGFYAPEEANAEALVCGAGSHTDTAGEEGASRCVPCGPGSSCSGDGRSVVCAAGSYQPGEGAQGCFPCPEGATTIGPGATLRSECFETFVRPEIGRPCSACAGGVEDACLVSRNGTYTINGQANLDRLCFELIGGAYRGHESSSGNSLCLDYRAPNWVLIDEGNFDEVTSVTCYHDD